MEQRKDYQLCEKIVQEVIGFLFSSRHLLLVVTLQNSPKALTTKEIAKELNVPKQLIRPVLYDLLEYGFVKEKIDGVGYYFIDYPSVIKNIVGCYVKVTEINEEENGQMDNVLKCSNPFCGWSCSYQNGVKNFEKGHFVCEECEGIMHLIDNDFSERIKVIKARKQLQKLKTMLNQLNRVYHSVEDYPSMYIEKIIYMREENEQRSSKSTMPIPALSGEMPWEKEEKEEEHCPTRNTNEKSEEFDIYENVEWQRPMFLKGRKMFVEKDFIKESPFCNEKVPRSPNIICNSRKKHRKSRSLISVNRKKILM